MPTMKDFIAEAATVREHLAPFIPAPALTAYLDARCEDLLAANERFDRARFLWACVSVDRFPR
jgi:hypothetical protein